MRSSRKIRNKPAIDYNSKVLPDDVKIDIAKIVRVFEFANANGGGSCLARAVIAQAVLTTCQLPSGLGYGAMLYRAGPDPNRDTLRFAKPGNFGGYLGSQFIGHAWNEIGDDIADFSAGDWRTEAEDKYATATDDADRALGPVQWQNPPPAFIWQSAQPLKTSWRPRGEPPLGGIWYGDWSKGDRRPDFSSHLKIVEAAIPMIERLVTDFHLLERLNDLHGVPTPDAPASLAG